MRTYTINRKTYEIDDKKFDFNTMTELKTEATLREIKKCVHSTREYKKAPNVNLLRSSEDIVAAVTTADCRMEVYSCGFAVYQASGKVAVLRMESTGHAWYRGDPELERGNQDIDLSDMIWTIAVTMRGEDLLEAHQQRSADLRTVSLSDDESDDESDEDENEHDVDAGVDVEAEVLRRMEEEEVLGVLTRRQRECAEMYYGMGMTQQEIADVLEVTQQNIDLALKGAKRKVKKIFEKI